MKSVLWVLLLLPTVAAVEVSVSQDAGVANADIEIDSRDLTATGARVCAVNQCVSHGMHEGGQSTTRSYGAQRTAASSYGTVDADDSTGISGWVVALPAAGLLATLAKLFYLGPGRIAALLLGPGRLLGIGALAGWSWPTDLENQTRKTLNAYIAANPGASIQEARGHAKVAWGTAVYHLQRMEKDGELISIRAGNHHRYWKAGTPESRHRHGWAVLEQPTTEKIAHVVISSPGIHQGDLCERLRLSASTASKHLKRLIETGLIVTKRCSRFTMYAPTDELDSLVTLRGQPLPG